MKSTIPCLATLVLNTLSNPATFMSNVEIRGEIFEGEPGSTKKQAEMNAAKVACQHFEERRKYSGSSVPVLGRSNMQNAMSMQSAGQEISVPQISTVTCNKTNGSDPTALPPDTRCQGPPQDATNKRRGRKNRNTEPPVGGPRRSGRLARNEAPTYVPMADKTAKSKKRKLEDGSTSSSAPAAAPRDAGGRQNEPLH